MKLFSKLTHRDINLSNRQLVNLIMLIIISTFIFVLPYVVIAEEKQDKDDNNIVEAEKYLNNYRSLNLENNENQEEFIIEEDTIEYNSDCNYYMFSGYYGFYERITQRVWNHALDLYYKGLIHGATPYQCTFFAQMWFYDVYGFNSTGYGPSENGGDMVYKIYGANTYYDEEGNFKHYFELSNEPKSMSILSITGMSHPLGHVMCIDEVDEKNGTITFSDGNVTNNSDIRIRVTLTMDEFRRQNPGYYVFATPTEELLQLVRDNKE